MDWITHFLYLRRLTRGYVRYISHIEGGLKKKEGISMLVDLGNAPLQVERSGDKGMPGAITIRLLLLYGSCYDWGPLSYIEKSPRANTLQPNIHPYYYNKGGP